MSEQNQPPLTDAASQVLEALTAEFRDQVLWYARQRALDSGVPGALSVGDVIRAADEANVGPRSIPRRSRVRLLALTYVVGGVSVAMLSVIALLYLAVRDATGNAPVVPAIVGFMGVVLAAVGGAAGVLAGRSRAVAYARGADLSLLSTRDRTGLFLARWIELEIAAREAVSLLAGESQANLAPSRIRDQLVDAGAFTPADAESFRALLDQRNKVVHGRDELSSAGAEQALGQVDRLMRKLRDPEKLLDAQRESRRQAASRDEVLQAKLERGPGLAVRDRGAVSEFWRGALEDRGFGPVELHSASNELGIRTSSPVPSDLQQILLKEFRASIPDAGHVSVTFLPGRSGRGLD